MAAALDRRRRPHRSAHGPKPVGGQRSGLQRGRTGRGEHVDRVDLSDLSRQPGSAARCAWSTWRSSWRWCSACSASCSPCWAPPGCMRRACSAGARCMLPAGALVYIAVPPARDFATSGLENGLVLAYLGLLWWMMVCWSQAAARASPAATGCADVTRRSADHPQAADAEASIAVSTHNTWSADSFDAALAFVAGLSVLVRPELALVGGLALVMMLVAARGWRRRRLIIARGRPASGGLPDLPDGLLRLAVSQHRAGQGRLGIEVAARLHLSGQLQHALSAVGARDPAGGSGGRGAGHPRPSVVDPAHRCSRATAGWRGWCKARPAVVVFILVSGLLQALYWIRQGGDFMHGRVLLTPLFCMLAPVAVIPLVLPDGARMARGAAICSSGRPSVLWLASPAGRCGRPIRAAWGRRHPGHLLRHRRRAAVLRPGHRPRAPAYGRGLSRLPADARRARRH